MFSIFESKKKMATSTTHGMLLSSEIMSKINGLLTNKSCPLHSTTEQTFSLFITSLGDVHKAIISCQRWLSDYWAIIGYLTMYFPYSKVHNVDLPLPYQGLFIHHVSYIYVCRIWHVMCIQYTWHVISTVTVLLGLSCRFK